MRLPPPDLLRRSSAPKGGRKGARLLFPLRGRSAKRGGGK
jgi:hypothetical protein